MSTWPTPVDRRLGRRLRCMTLRAACVLAGDALLEDLPSELLSRSFSLSSPKTNPRVTNTHRLSGDVTTGRKPDGKWRVIAPITIPSHQQNPHGPEIRQPDVISLCSLITLATFKQFKKTNKCKPYIRNVIFLIQNSPKFFFFIYMLETKTHLFYLVLSMGNEYVNNRIL